MSVFLLMRVFNLYAAVRCFEELVVLKFLQFRILKKSLGIGDVGFDCRYQRIKAVEVLLGSQVSDDADFK